MGDRDGPPQFTSSTGEHAIPVRLSYSPGSVTTTVFAPRAGQVDGQLLTSAAGPSTTGPPVDLRDALRTAFETIRDQPCGGYTPPGEGSGGGR